MTRRFISRIRALAAIALVAALPQAHAVVDQTYSGSWFNPNAGGHGITIEITSPTTAALSWYTYDNNGNQAWVIGSGNIDQATNSFTLNAAITRGMVFGTFTPAPTVADWGTIKVTFTGCNTGTMEWTSNYTQGNLQFSNGSQPLQRLTGFNSLPCGVAPGVYTVGYIGPVAAYATVSPSGKLSLFQENLSALYEAQLTGAGMANTFTFTGTGIASAGVEFRDDSTTTTWNGTGTFARGDFINGNYNGNHITSNSFSFTYDNRYVRGSAVSRLAGNWLITLREQEKLAISATGVVTSRDTSGCEVEGNVTAPDGNVNIYIINLTISDCTVSGQNLNGTYTGQGALLDLQVFGDNRQLLAPLRSNTAALVRSINKE